MRKIAFAVPALLLAGVVAAQGGRRPNPDHPADPQAKVPAVEFRSAFEGYRAFADEERRDWRQANDDVRAAGGHAGHKPGQGEGGQGSKPQPGKPHHDRGEHK